MSTTLTPESLPLGEPQEPGSSEPRIGWPAQLDVASANLCLGIAASLGAFGRIYSARLQTDQQAVVTRFGAVAEPRVLPGGSLRAALARGQCLED